MSNLSQPRRLPGSPVAGEYMGHSTSRGPDLEMPSTDAMDFTRQPGELVGTIEYPPYMDTARKVLGFYLSQPISNEILAAARTGYPIFRDSHPAVRAAMDTKIDPWIAANPSGAVSQKEFDKMNVFGRKIANERAAAWNQEMQAMYAHILETDPDIPFQPELRRLAVRSVCQIGLAGQYAASALSDDEWQKFLSARVSVASWADMSVEDVDQNYGAIHFGHLLYHHIMSGTDFEFDPSFNNRRGEDVY